MDFYGLNAITRDAFDIPKGTNQTMGLHSKDTRHQGMPHTGTGHSLDSYISSWTSLQVHNKMSFGNSVKWAQGLYNKYYKDYPKD